MRQKSESHRDAILSGRKRSKLMIADNRGSGSIRPFGKQDCDVLQLKDFQIFMPAFQETTISDRKGNCF